MGANTPDDFYSFSDFLGLNKGAGDQMEASALDSYDGMNLKDIQKLSQENYAASGNVGKTVNDGQVYNPKTGKYEMATHDTGDGGVYDSTKAGISSGLTSYSEFLKGMNDPASRQATLEKVYGKGNVSWLDSALSGAGGGGRLESAQDRLKKVQSSTDAMGVMAGERRAGAIKQRDTAKATALAEQAKKQADYDKRVAFEKKYKEDTENARVDDWVKRSGNSAFSSGFGRMGTYDPKDTMRGEKDQGFDFWRWLGSGGYNNNQNQRDAAKDALGGFEKATGKRWDQRQGKYV